MGARREAGRRQGVREKGRGGREGGRKAGAEGREGEREGGGEGGARAQFFFPNHVLAAIPVR